MPICAFAALMFFVQSIKFLLRCQLALFGDLQTTSFSIFIPVEVMLCLSVFVLIACSKFYRVTSSFQLQQVLIRMKAIRRRSKRIYPFSFILLCILKLEHLVMFVSWNLMLSALVHTFLWNSFVDIVYIIRYSLQVLWTSIATIKCTCFIFSEWDYYQIVFLNIDIF